VRYKLITKKLIHLFKRLSFRFGKEEPIACKCDDIEDEEDVEVLKLNGAECLRGKLCEDQVDCPVREGCDGITEGTNLDREDLKFSVSPWKCSLSLILLTSAGYTQEMIPRGV
jgi:hypothetical protein